MPLNGKANPVSKPSWLKDSSPAQSTTPTTTPARPAWARKTSEAKKEESPVEEKRDSPAKIALGKTIKKDSESPKKEVTTRLQSREIKVPLKVEKTVPTQSILKKPEVKIKQDLKEEHQTLNLRDVNKTPSKSPSKTPPKSNSTTPSKSPTPAKSAASSKSPSKTPDYSDSDEDSSDETETESSEEETDSDEDFSDDEKPSSKPPSPTLLRKQLVIAPGKRVAAKTPEKSQPERSQSPEYTFKKPELKKVVTRQKSDVREKSPSPEPKFLKHKLRKVPSSLKTREPSAREKLPYVDLKKTPPKPEPDHKLQRKMSEVFPHKPSILRNESSMKSELENN